MWRIAAIAIAGALGAFALVLSESADLGGWSATASGANAVAAAKEAQMRVCVGPARVTIGGQPAVGLAFGGEGCDRRNAHLVGIRLLRAPSGTSPPPAASPFRGLRL